MLNELVQTATSMITGVPPRDGWIDTDLGGLRIRRIAHRQAFECNLLGPLCGIVLQGAKNVVTGDRQFTSVAGDAVIVSHHVPAVSRVTEGSDAFPYLGLMLPLDLSLLGSIELEIRDAIPARRALGAIEKMCASREMLDAFLRLVSLSRTPVEARVLAPLVVRELHLRFLLAPEGAILRDLLSRDSRASRISRAIAEIRQTGHLTPVASLARTAGMGPSAFHAHFKAVTGMAPLAFQKELRLTRARDMLLDPERSVAATAFAVGYESPAQFSREYSRRFGRSPRNHRAAS